MEPSVVAEAGSLDGARFRAVTRHHLGDEAAALLTGGSALAR